MTVPAIVIGHDGIARRVEPVAPCRVFVAEMPAQRPASYAAHTGLAELVEFHRALRDGVEDLAIVRLADGRLRPVRVGAVHDPGAIVARRILPAPVAERRRA